MENLQSFLIATQIVLSISLVIIILMQKTDEDSLKGIGSGSGGANSVVSSKTANKFLIKLTLALIALFMLNCLVLASITKASSRAIEEDLKKIIQEEESSQDAKTSTKPTVPNVE